MDWPSFGVGALTGFSVGGVFMWVMCLRARLIHQRPDPDPHADPDGWGRL